MKRTTRATGLVASLLFSLAFVATAAGGDAGVTELVPNTAILLNQSGGGGGNGGETRSTTSRTHIFAPSADRDYKRLGGEPTTVVDRYPFTPGQFGNTTTQNQYRDLVYVSNPLGVAFPGFSEFYKSSDGGTTFRVPSHNPFFTEPTGTEESGGGDSHHAVGEITHSVFLIDLSGGCLTMNISRDLGETFSSNKLGCEANPGAIDDRQWVATDETAPDGQDVYLNFNNDTGCIATSEPGCSLVFVKSTNDGGTNTAADFAASPCNAFTQTAIPGATSDDEPTACPDPTDPDLWISGPVVVDKSNSARRHTLYIPFERQVGGNFVIYLAKSTDLGETWTRHPVANVGPHDAANIFPQLTIDTAGNLYYTWSQTTGNPDAGNGGGETDAYYTYSTDGGATWATPIDITKETGDSAVFPWMVAGSPGQVDLVLYRANSGLDPNVAFTNASGQPDNSCTTPTASCIPNTTVWNTYFGQSQNALNTGANFKLVQI